MRGFNRTSIARKIGHFLRNAGDKILLNNGLTGTWIDVGAHHAETTLHHAHANPALRIYAIEPNLRAASQLIGRAPNLVVFPVAISEANGSADFHLNAYDQASSLLPFDQAALNSWIGGDALTVQSVLMVPTMRLDTFMDLAGILKVDFLKVDTQGMDLAVLRSAGSRLRDISKIIVEVPTTRTPLYSGGASKDEMCDFMIGSGFRLAQVETQSYGQEQNLTFLRNDLHGTNSSTSSSAPERA